MPACIYELLLFLTNNTAYMCMCCAHINTYIYIYAFERAHYFGRSHDAYSKHVYQPIYVCVLYLLYTLNKIHTVLISILTILRPYCAFITVFMNNKHTPWIVYQDHIHHVSTTLQHMLYIKKYHCQSHSLVPCDIQTFEIHHKYIK